MNAQFYLFRQFVSVRKQSEIKFGFHKKNIENCTYFLIELFFNLTFDYNASKTEALSICQNSKQNIII